MLNLFSDGLSCVNWYLAFKVSSIFLSRFRYNLWIKILLMVCFSVHVQCFFLQSHCLSTRLLSSIAWKNNLKINFTECNSAEKNPSHFTFLMTGFCDAFIVCSFLQRHSNKELYWKKWNKLIFLFFNICQFISQKNYFSELGTPFNLSQAVVYPGSLSDRYFHSKCHALDCVSKETNKPFSFHY